MVRTVQENQQKSIWNSNPRSEEGAKLTMDNYGRIWMNRAVI